MYEDIRYCDICGKPMHDGYCINDGDEYFCSSECLHVRYTEEEYLNAYDEGWAYWTEW